MYLSIVIPIYNEEKRILPSLEKINVYLDKQNYLSEIILVDDGSNDNTLTLINKFSESHARIKIIKNSSNQGKGASVKKGVLNAEGDFILFTDADLSTPIEDVERLFYWIHQGFDLAIGSRHQFDPCVTVSNIIERKLKSNIFNYIVKTSVLSDFNDTQCGFKLFAKEAAQKLFSCQKLMGYGFDVEILYLSIKAGFKCKEVAINWKYTPTSKVRLIDDSIKIVKEILQIKEMHKNTFIENQITPSKQMVIR